MQTVNMFQAKSSLSKLVESIESGREDEIVIARHGRPAARLTRLEERPAQRRLGVAKGQFEVPDDIDGDNETIARLFLGGEP
ncbi:MAG: type II toxin-antitoxin system Phd/YefM family antitoxin [Thermodesulfobacteriota bacterium]